jgi:hypothetical protein
MISSSWRRALDGNGRRLWRLAQSKESGTVAALLFGADATLWLVRSNWGDSGKPASVLVARYSWR